MNKTINPLKSALALIGLAVLLITAYSSSYIVMEGRQAVITRFGKPVRDPVTKAGLSFKAPFVEDVRFVDKRILTWDGHPSDYPTKDKKIITVDTTARWRITDALKFIQTVRGDEDLAKSKLTSFLNSATRDVIGSHNLVEAVRNTNSILDKLKEMKEESAKNPSEEEEVTGEVAPIEVGRDRLSQMIVERASKDISQFGVELIDVQLRRISYQESVERKVYDRMISERRRIAEKIRSVGMGEQAKIEGKTSRDLQTIESQAYRKAQEIKGKAEAEAIAIYAASLGRDPSFFEFVRTMEAYSKSLGEDTEYILSTESDFLKLLGK